jgi:diguanylate cyclase (GGDEF)-like protein
VSARKAIDTLLRLLAAVLRRGLRWLERSEPAGDPAAGGRAAAASAAETAAGPGAAGPDALDRLGSLSALYESAGAAERGAALHGRPFAVLMVELAQLPLVNARDGYRAGDELIRDAARVVDEVARAQRATAGRHGGARLALVVPDAGDAEAEALARELHAALPEAAGPLVAHAVRRPAETGAQVLDRARAALRPPQEPVRESGRLRIPRARR